MRRPTRSGMRFLAALMAALWVAAAVPAFANSHEVSDPFERMNRGTFWFNERVDKYFLEPVAKGWDGKLILYRASPEASGRDVQRRSGETTGGSVGNGSTVLQVTAGENALNKAGLTFSDARAYTA